MSSIASRIQEGKIIATIQAGSEEEGIRAATACADGGVRILEISQTSQGASEIIQVLSTNEELLVGAGLILNTRMAELAVSGGARFLFTPNCDHEVIRFAKSNNIFALAGATTPSEVLRCWQMGADMVKIYPASYAGGAGYLEFLKRNFSFMELIPAGGVTLETVNDYLRAGAAAVGVDEDLASRDRIRDGAWEEITRRSRDFCSKVEHKG